MCFKTKFDIIVPVTSQSWYHIQWYAVFPRMFFLFLNKVPHFIILLKNIFWCRAQHKSYLFKFINSTNYGKYKNVCYVKYFLKNDTVILIFVAWYYWFVLLYLFRRHLFLLEKCRMWGDWDVEWMINVDDVLTVPHIQANNLVIKVKQVRKFFPREFYYKPEICFYEMRQYMKSVRAKHGFCCEVGAHLNTHSQPWLFL